MMVSRTVEEKEVEKKEEEEEEHEHLNRWSSDKRRRKTNVEMK